MYQYNRFPNWMKQLDNFHNLIRLDPTSKEPGSNRKKLESENNYEI